MVVFFDVDGTLIDNDSQIIPQSAVRAIERLRENGHTPVVNTGRPYAHIDPRIRQMAFSGWVCGCGMEVMLNGHWLYRAAPSEELCRKIRADVRDCGMQVLYESCLGGVYVDGEYSAHPAIVKEYTQMAGKGFFVKELEENGFMKFITYDGKNCRREEFLRRMDPHFTCIDRGQTMLELVLKGYSKAGGMERLLDALGVTREDALAVGDSTNDLPMFRAAKHTACMGNGMEELKRKSEFVTDTVLNNGIEKALKHFGLI